MKTDKNRPVSSIKHNDKRAAIPDSAHQGEEEMALIRSRLSFLHISPQLSALSPPPLYITSPRGMNRFVSITCTLNGRKVIK